MIYCGENQQLDRLFDRFFFHILKCSTVRECVCVCMDARVCVCGGGGVHICVCFRWRREQGRKYSSGSSIDDHVSDWFTVIA